MNYHLAYAISDPLTTTNNRFGVHIISPTDNEAQDAAKLVNSSGGDWGYVTILIESGNRDHDKWQTFFNTLRRLHLIPIVRLATQPEGNFWKKPYEGEEQAWADFLDGLNWPVKNRYIIVYNEPNQAQEWGNSVDPADYAQVLDKTITALKNKSSDFFVLNAGFDAAAPEKPPAYKDEVIFLQQMNQAVPGIFNRLDGWVSHSYPQGFVGSPTGLGRGTTGTWVWEQSLLKELGVDKKLPVFITETGWKHAEGLSYNQSLPTSDQVGKFFQQAFQGAWSDPQVIAVTPFLLNYQQAPFDHFSFKKITGEPQDTQILGAQFPDYYPQYQAVLDITKSAGRPVQEVKAKLEKGELPSSVVAGEQYLIPLTFKNTGQSIWSEYDSVKLVASSGGEDFLIKELEMPRTFRIEPGKDYTFYLKLIGPSNGSHQLSLQLETGGKVVEGSLLTSTISVKDPVILQVKAKLDWKNSFAGDYFLNIATALGDNIQKLVLDSNGQSGNLEARYLFPDSAFDFTLERPYYKPKTIHQTVVSGINTLDFGLLEPDILSALLHPDKLWSLLPFSK